MYKQLENGIFYMEDSQFLYYLMSKKVTYRDIELQKEFEKFTDVIYNVKPFTLYYNSICFKPNSKDEGDYTKVSTSVSSKSRYVSFYGSKTPINPTHCLNEKIWNNKIDYQNKNKVNVEDILHLYHHNCHIASENNRTLKEVTNTIKLDNDMVLVFDLNVDEKDYKKGKFNHENIVVRIINKDGYLKDWLAPVEYVRELQVGGPYIHDFKKFFSYKTSPECIDEMKHDEERLIELNKEHKEETTYVEEKAKEILPEIKFYKQLRFPEEVLKVEDVHDKEARLRESYSSLSFNLRKQAQENIEPGSTSKPVANKIKVSREFLIEDLSYGKGKIKDKYKDCLYVFDLSNIDFSGVDVRGVNFKNCNVTLLNPQTVYNKDLSGTNFSKDTEEPQNTVFGAFANFEGVNISGANFSGLEYENICFDGAKKDENTILPGEVNKSHKSK